MEALQSVPHLWNRLKSGRRVTDLVGMRPIENGYRQAFGPNWALVGDAVHYKDPIDGQGIYDALLESKLLAQAIVNLKQQGISWEQAGATYQQQMLAATHPTFMQTVTNVKQTIFTKLPEPMIKTFARYLISDPGYQRQYLRNMSRAVDPAEMKTGPGVFLRILLQGIAGDIRQGHKSG
jgi:flavin-dependent dehydrogenase